MRDNCIISYQQHCMKKQTNWQFVPVTRPDDDGRYYTYYGSAAPKTDYIIMITRSC